MALETLAEPFGQANRPEIQRRDQAGGPRPAERVEGDPQSRSCSLERVTPPPVMPSEGPADFALRPPFRIVKTHATHEGATPELLNHPHAISPQCPVSNEHRELTPCVLTR